MFNISIWTLCCFTVCLNLWQITNFGFKFCEYIKFFFSRFLAFDNYRIPRENLLDKFGDITEEGHYVTPYKVVNYKYLKLIVWILVNLWLIDWLCNLTFHAEMTKNVFNFKIFMESRDSWNWISTYFSEYHSNPWTFYIKCSLNVSNKPSFQFVLHSEYDFVVFIKLF